MKYFLTLVALLIGVPSIAQPLTFTAWSGIRIPQSQDCSTYTVFGFTNEVSLELGEGKSVSRSYGDFKAYIHFNWAEINPPSENGPVWQLQINIEDRDHLLLATSTHNFSSDDIIQLTPFNLVSSLGGSPCSYFVEIRVQGDA